MSNYTGRLDRYHLIRKLGFGAFGQVYLAEDCHHQNTVAIKLLSSLTSQDLPEFLDEVRTMVRLNHPHIVKILDFGIDAENQTPFLVMEYAPHGTLRQRHPEGSRVPLLTLASYVTQLADALQTAHDDLVIHRDIKPQNMLLNQQNGVLLSDFGVATMMLESSMFSTQSVVGTIPYASPEQSEGHPCPESDQYALAVVVYEWLCGRRPFSGSIVQIAVQHKLNPPPSLREQDPAISAELEQVIFKALAKNPQERFASVKDFARALQAACGDTRPPMLRGTDSVERRSEELGIRSDELGGATEYMKEPDQSSELDPWGEPTQADEGRTLEYLETYQGLLESCDRAIALYSKDVHAWSHKAWALNTLGRYEEALHACEEAIALHPKYSYAWNNRGIALQGLQRYEQALDAYGRAAKLGNETARENGRKLGDWLDSRFRTFNPK